ncbi:hypothetical protein ACJIZ3_005347 [Penstemon smallii]|uniref:Uncharacterized protein n=1 Tax=Penstemon smallii TaxID=265156 RepID=A0ABD3S4U6_9LAMI
MSNHLISLFFTFNLLLISIHGRTLQKNYTNETNSLSFSNIKVKAVSHATDDTYTGQTDPRDVVGLMAIWSQYVQLVEANPDPCTSPMWTWIECNSDLRVVALNLGKNLLIGTLPDFSLLDALQRIDLSQNSFIGPVPAFLGKFTDLQEL